MTKISNPHATSEQLTKEELEVYVKDLLVPIIDKFVKNHKGKIFTEIDIENLYKDLNNAIYKDPRITDKWNNGIDQHEVRKEMAIETAKEINKEGELSTRDKLIQGFGKFCKKIGLERISAACLKHVQKVNLTKEIEKIANKVASTKTSINKVGNSESAKLAKPIKQSNLSR